MTPLRTTPLALAAWLVLPVLPAQAATFTWTSGSFIPGTTAPEPLAAADVLNIQGSSGKSFNGVVFTNDGSVNWLASSGGISFSAGASVQNNGLWDAQGNASLFHASGAAASFSNAGTLRKSAGTGTTSIGNDAGFVFVNSGTVEAQVGTLQLGGSNTFNAGTVFSGAGSVLVTSASTFNGAFQSANLTLQSGASTAITGNDAVIGGQVNWVGGGLTGNWTVASGATLTGLAGSATANKAINGAGTLLTNNGSLVIDSATGIALNSGAALVNNGTFDIRVNPGVFHGSGAPTSLTNNGVLLKSGGTGTTTVGNEAALVFVNNGSIDAQVGTLQLSGSNTFNAGTVFSGAGSVVVNSASTFNGSFQATNLQLVTGASVNLTGNNAVLGGQVGWSGGNLSGGWTIASGATLTGLGSSATANKAIGGAGTLLTNNGTVALNSATGISLRDGGAIVNNGLLDFQGNAGMSYGSGSAVSLTNNGRLQKSGGTGTTTIGGSAGAFTFVNHGVVDVQVGTLRLTDALTNDGTLTGNATLQVSGGLTNRGSIAPGSFGVGTLSLTGGTLTQEAGAVFAVDLTSLVSHDLLNVTGTALLGGTLALHCLGACSYAVGDTFTILDASTALVGSFASVSLSGFASGAFTVLYDVPSDSVRLLVTEAVTAAVPEPANWALFAAGLAALGFLVNRRGAIRRLQAQANLS